MRICAIMLTFLSSVLTLATPGRAEVTAVKAGRILTVSGDPVTDGVILIEDGKIVEVGSAPAGSSGTARTGAATPGCRGGGTTHPGLGGTGRARD
jgi:imidazolonepropionase-like amidohydrolase